MRVRGGLALTSVAFHVDQLWFSAPGGIGTYVRELLAALQRADADLELVPFRARVRSDRIVRWTVPMPGIVVLPGSIRTRYPMWNLFGVPSLPQSVSRCDLLHATNPVAVPPAATRQKLVVTVHDLAFVSSPELFPPTWRWLYRSGMRAATKRADAIITPSRATADDLLARTEVRPDRVHVVPLAASLPSFPSAGEDPDHAADRSPIPGPYVLFVGTLEPRKNLVRLVRAYRKAVGTALPHALVLAGPMGWKSEALEAELALAGPGTIVRTGSVDGVDLDALYRGAAAFAYPSLFEGFGLPVLEAMGRGVPTIASDIPPIREVAGDAAFLVHPESEEDLAAAIERVLTDDAFAADLRRKGPIRASGFTWDATAEGTLAVYRKVLGA
jgi:glycosyltransferase involved in cell wall biosynthesis